MVKKQTIFILTIILLLSTVLIGCEDNTEVVTDLQNKITGMEDEISKLEQDIETKEEEFSDLERDNHYLTQEKDYYREFIDEYLSGLSEEQLLEISLNEWTYSLYVVDMNDKEHKEQITVPENGIVNLDFSSFIIVLAGSRPVFPILKNYEDIFMQGSIKDYDSDSNFKIIDADKIKYTRSGADGTVVGSKTYEVSDLNKGETVKFEISDTLKSRLGLDTNIIEVSIK